MKMLKMFNNNVLIITRNKLTTTTIKRFTTTPSKHSLSTPTNNHSSTLLPLTTIPTFKTDLRWMLNKQKLSQDMLLLGPTPTTYKRRLAFEFARACNLQVEYVVITSETTEADLKTRRELKNGNLIFHNQAPVRAALEGKVLILDGLERAERNVLPSLNNLLENREMNLDDGRLLVHHQRYEMLQKQQQQQPRPNNNTHPTQNLSICPVSPNFIVVALALPVPPFVKLGRPLDPPLRSRFQARVILPPSPHEMLNNQSSSSNNLIHYSFAIKQTEQYLQTTNALTTGNSASTDPIDTQIDFLDMFALSSSQRILSMFPHEPVSRVVKSCAPFLHCVSPKIYDLIVTPPQSLSLPSSSFSNGYGKVERNGNELIWYSKDNTERVRVPYKTITSKPTPPTTTTPTTNPYISSILQDLTIGQRHVLLVGEVGCGKTRLAQETIQLLTGNINSLPITMPVTRDTTARDLLVRRTIDPNTGDSYFTPNELVNAAKRGDIIILDGVERLEYSAFVSLTRILMDGIISLPDSTTIQVSPLFRVIAIASVPVGNALLARFNGTAAETTTTTTTFLFSNEITSCFSTHVITLDNSTKRSILVQHFSETEQPMIERVLETSQALETDGVSNIGLSLRQMFRLIRLCEDDDDLRERLESAFLSRFMPITRREAFEKALNRVLVRSRDKHQQQNVLPPTSTSTDIIIEPGNHHIPKFTSGFHPELIPSVRFHDNPSHSLFMRRILLDFKRGERDFIAIGGQGVGKNKIADRLCELLQAEREYIQLHRDSTMASIILAPNVEQGRIIYSDSPLVRAAKFGRVLVIDEADKAPAEVLGLLKSLVEDGEMFLGDGRKLVRRKANNYQEQCSSSSSSEDVTTITCHPNFCIWILANRPGFPFLGNEFTRVLSDVFSIHVLHNPDKASELALLQSYAPNVDVEILDLLASAFGKLRDLSDSGVLAYPFSARDAVAVAKHLEGFPSDGVIKSLENVLDFDVFLTPNIRIEIERAFQSVGIPFAFKSGKDRLMNNVAKGIVDIAEERGLPGLVEVERWERKG